MRDADVLPVTMASVPRARLSPLLRICPQAGSNTPPLISKQHQQHDGQAHMYERPLRSVDHLQR